MDADDPRHGTEAGCREHYRQGTSPCAPCLDAHRRRNTLRLLYPHKCPALGSQRRIQALQAIGYGRDRIAQEMGYSDGGSIAYLMQADSLLVTTAAKVAEVYDRLSMVVPIGAGPSRARTWARRHRYAPPLAWDDIDDPDEQPDGIRTNEGDHRGDLLADLLADLLERGCDLGDALRELRIDREALRVWCSRNNHLDTYAALARRERRSA